MYKVSSKREKKLQQDLQMSIIRYSNLIKKINPSVGQSGGGGNKGTFEGIDKTNFEGKLALFQKEQLKSEVRRL